MTSARRESPDLGFVHLYLPGSGDPTTLLVLHGTGGDENDLVPLARRILPQANVLSPRGKVIENGAPRFFRRLSEGVFDMNDLVDRTNELAEFVRGASSLYRFDQRRVVAVGYSNGANIAASALLLHPRLLAGAVLLRPLIPFQVQSVPDLSGVKVLIESGAGDDLIPKELVERLAAVLERGGAKLRLHWQQGGHSLSESDVEVARQWISEEFPDDLRQ